MVKKVKCVCSADVCGHNGEQCGKPVKFIVKTQTVLENDELGELREMGICEACWTNIGKQFRFLVVK